MNQTPGDRVRILLADDNPMLLRAFLRLLEEQFDVVSTAADGRALVEQYDRLNPEVVVTDIAMPLLNGFEALRILKRRGSPKVIFLTVHEEQAFIDEARALGAAGYVLKRSRASVLVDAIRSAREGTFFLAPELEP
jgi:DNA-binding NarL/FixJ family response regulator